MLNTSRRLIFLVQEEEQVLEFTMVMYVCMTRFGRKLTGRSINQDRYYIADLVLMSLLVIVIGLFL